MRWRNFARLVIFPNPSTLLGRPACELVGSIGIILKDDDLAVLRYRFDRAAHLKGTPTSTSGKTYKLYCTGDGSSRCSEKEHQRGSIVSCTAKVEDSRRRVLPCLKPVLSTLLNI